MKAALGVLLALPVAGLHAEPIVVEYAGTVTEVNDLPPGQTYAVGDHIAGRLFIDPLLANPDLDPTPNHALYRSFSPGFVSGFFPSAGDGFDEVSVSHNLATIGIEGPIDGFGIADWLVGMNASQDSGKVFNLSARVRGFLTGTGLDQSFELTSADADEPVEDLSGGISFFLGGPTTVRFILSHLTVKPGRCFTSS